MAGLGGIRGGRGGQGLGDYLWRKGFKEIIMIVCELGGPQPMMPTAGGYITTFVCGYSSPPLIAFFSLFMYVFNIKFEMKKIQKNYGIGNIWWW